MIKIRALSKINLCLDIISRTSSGYHEIQTVFHAVSSPADELEIYEAQENDNVAIAHPPQNHLIKMEENLAFKALKLLKSKYSINKFARITIKKTIPIAAGLGGGSSDAAAALKGLNELWNLDLSSTQLMDLGSQLGADVPFFILGGTALGTHFGEKITPLGPIKGIEFAVHPPETESQQEDKTKQMYESLDLSKCGQNVHKTEALIRAIEDGNNEEIIKNLHNDFETLTPPPKNHHLSGSGPSTFTVGV